MAKIEATETQTFEVKAPLEAVYKAFSDLEIIKENFVGLERAEFSEGNVARWILKEKVDKGLRFKGDYTLKYDGNGKDRITWRSIAGNIDNDAEVVLTQVGSSVRVFYRETIAPDLPIPGLMARVFKPIVAREVRKDLVKYAESVKSYLARKYG
jgi:uncharacterized membrane protein